MNRVCRLAGAIALGALAGCRAGPAAPLTAADIGRSVESRRIDSETVRQAAALAPLEPLGIRPPKAAGSGELGDEACFALALAWNADVLAARRRGEAAIARAGGLTSLPRPVLSSEFVEAAGGGVQAQVMLVFQLLAWVGGEWSIRRELGEAEVAEAVSSLEKTVWSIRHDVRRRLIERERLSERVRLLGESLDRLSAAKPRVTALAERGRLSPGSVADHSSRLETVRARQAIDRSNLESYELGLLAWLGLPEGQRRPFQALRAESAGRGSDTDTASLIDGLPVLRQAKREYALAEARVRLAAARQAPALGLGPMANISRDSFLGGGSLQIELPLTHPERGPFGEALAARAAARDRAEQGLLDALSALHSGRVRLAGAEAARSGASASLEATQRMAEAARARWSVSFDALPEFLDAESALLQAGLEFAESTAGAERAAVDLAEASGVQP